MYGVVEHLAGLGLRPATVIDVGAAHGTYELYEGFPSSQHVLLEPLREYEPYLQRVAQRYRARYVLVAAGERPGTAVFNVHGDLEGSSLLREVEGVRADGVPRDVPVVTLDQVCGDLSLRGPYLIKVDVQGAELKVLQGARGVLSDTEAVILEVSLFRFMVDGPDLHDVVTSMKQLGFVAYDIFGGHVRPLDGALAQVDMVFVQENGPLRRVHAYATAAQRDVLNRKRGRG